MKQMLNFFKPPCYIELIKSFISGNTAHRKTKKETETDRNTETHSESQADRRTDRQN